MRRPPETRETTAALRGEIRKRMIGDGLTAVGATILPVQVARPRRALDAPLGILMQMFRNAAFRMQSSTRRIMEERPPARAGRKVIPSPLGLPGTCRRRTP